MPKNLPKSSNSIIPLGSIILITRSEQKTHSSSGIILPDSVEESNVVTFGKVVAVGESAYIEGKLIPSSLKKGDEVLFGRGEVIVFEGVEYILIPESKILAKIAKK